VRFDAVGLTSSEILALAVGDVIPLNHPVDRPFTVTVDGMHLYDGISGRRGKRLATLIVDANRDAGWR
jgi:flagellar motor switch protein FliM